MNGEPTGSFPGISAEEAERISLHGDPQAQPIPGQAIDHVLGEIKVRSVAETELDAQQIKLN